MAANFSQNANGTLNIKYNGQPSLFIPATGTTGYNRHNLTGYGNLTLLLSHAELCNTTICDLTLAPFEYIPSLAGNALYAALFGLCILLNLFFGVRYKTWGYMIAMCLGLSGELIGYIGRLLLHENIFDPTGNNFLIYIVCLTLSPAMLSAAIYLCLARIVVIYGEELSRFKPRTYTLIFCGCDLFSLVLQAGGGGIAAGADAGSQEQMGINMMLAGLVVQVVSLFLFGGMCAEFGYRLYNNPLLWNSEYAKVYNSRRFKACLGGLATATLTIFVRSVYRVAELSGGFRGPLANDQVGFMVLEGGMVVVAVSCLSVLHPGWCFGGKWGEANFKFGLRLGRGKGKGGKGEGLVVGSEGESLEMC